MNHNSLIYNKYKPDFVKLKSTAYKNLNIECKEFIVPPDCP